MWGTGYVIKVMVSVRELCLGFRVRVAVTVKFCSSLSLNITAFLHHIDVLCQLCIRQGDEATLGKLFTHTRASVTKQQIWYRSRGCPAAGKVSVGLASSHWPCVTNFDGLST